MRVFIRESFVPSGTVPFDETLLVEYAVREKARANQTVACQPDGTLRHRKVQGSSCHLSET